METDPGKCTDCGNTGYIVVPHPKFCNAMEWKPNGHNEQGHPKYVTAAMFCHCWKGRKFSDRHEQDVLTGKPPLTMTIGKYEEMVNGNWRQQVKERDEQRNAVSFAEAGMDGKSAKEFISRLASRFGK